MLLTVNSKAQVYAPDTTFHFQTASLQYPEYELVQFLGSVNNLNLAYINKIPESFDLSPTPALALISEDGSILLELPHQYYIKNSLSKDGFIYSDKPYPSSSSDPLIHISINDFEKRHIKLQTYKYLRNISVENDYILAIDIDFNYLIFNLEGRLLEQFSKNSFKEADFSDFQFNVHQVVLDSLGYKYILAAKSPKVDNTNSFEFYKAPIGEPLKKKHLVFEVKDAQFGQFPVSLSARIINNQIHVIAKSHIPTISIQLLSYDFEGKQSRKGISLPLINEDPNSNYDFLPVENAKNVYVYGGRLNPENFTLYHFKEDGLSAVLTYENTGFSSLFESIHGLHYQVYSKENRVIDLNTLSDSEFSLPVKTVEYEPAVVWVDVLKNDDFWLAYKNPFNASRTYIKYQNLKEVFRSKGNLKNHYLLADNSVLLQDLDNNKTKITEENSSIEISLPGQVIQTDTVNKHYYTLEGSNISKRYHFNNNIDSNFHWEGPPITDEIIPLPDGRIYNQGKRYYADGSIDYSFNELHKSTASGYSGNIYRMRKFGEVMILIDAVCSYSCNGSVYIWNINDDTPKKVDSTDIYNYLYRYFYSVERDSLVLEGQNRLGANLEVDSTFIVKGNLGTSYFSSPFDTKLNDKKTAIFSDHSILTSYNNEIYRFAVDNNFWMEFRNVPQVIKLSDSLMANGYPVEVFTSDGSEATLSVPPASPVDYRGPNNLISVKGNRIYFTGDNGRAILKANSTKGGQDVLKEFQIDNSELPTENIVFYPADTSLRADFGSFPIKIAYDTSKFELIVSGEGGNLENGVLFSSDVAGNIKFEFSAKAAGIYPKKKVYEYPVFRQNQEMSYINLPIGTANSPLVLCPSSFPARIPVSLSSGLVPDLEPNTNYFYLAEEFFLLKKDSIYLNPKWRELPQRFNLSYLGDGIDFAISVKEPGNQKYNEVHETYYARLNFRDNCLMATRSKVFPNPAQKEISVVSVNENSAYLISVYDLLGKYLTTINAQPNSSILIGFDENGKRQTATKFALDGIPNGIYFIEYFLGSQIYRQRIIIHN